MATASTERAVGAASIATLPPEVLCLITDRLDAFDITYLYLCGNFVLNDALGRRGGVVRFKVKLSPTMKFGFPTVVYHFAHLEILHFAPNDQKAWSPKIGAFDVTKLSRSLQVLKLPFVDAWISFFKPLQRKTSQTTGHLQPYHLSSILPDLRRLKLHRQPLRSLCDPHFLKVLPASITRYDMASTFALPELKSLPIALQHLEFAFSNKTKDWNWYQDPQFPPYLTRLVVENCPSTMLLRYLSPSLKHLSLSYSNKCHKLMTAEDNQWKLLPRELETLVITAHSVTLALLDDLPRSLLTLHIYATERLLIVPEDLLHLPRTLTDADLDFIEIRKDIPEFWPEVDGEAPYLTNLPPLLKNIPIGTSTYLTPAFVTSLPQHLETFTLAHFSHKAVVFGTTYGIELFNLLPASLTNISFDLYAAPDGIRNRLDSLTLPPNLIHVWVYKPPLIFALALALLKKLQTLTSHYFPAPKENLKLVLPSTLTKLHLSDPILRSAHFDLGTCSPNLIELAITGWRTEPTKAFFMQGLPVGLHVLQLTHNLPTDWEPSRMLNPGIFTRFTSLQKLQLGTFSRSLSDEHLAHFPPSLFELTLEGEVISLTQKGVDYLPKRLVRLLLPKSKKVAGTFDLSAFPNLTDCSLANPDAQPSTAHQDILANMELVDHDWKPPTQ